MNSFLSAIYRKDEHSLGVLLNSEELDDRRHLELSEALRILVGDNVKNQARRGRESFAEAKFVGQTDLNLDDKLKFAEMLLLAGTDPNTKGSCDGESLITQAVSHQHLDMVQLFITFACDINATDNRGRTALHAAVLGPDSIIGILLASHADPNIQDIDGCTPLTLACSQLSSDFVINSEVIKMLLIDTNVNLPDVHGKTALHYAAVAPSTAVLQLLLNCDRVNVDARDVSGCTPLILTAQQLNARTEHLQMIVKKGYDVMIQDNSGNTALHYVVAVSEGKELIPLLVAAGADLNQRNADGIPPLYAAAKSMQVDNVMSLIQLNAEVPRTFKTDEIKPLHLIDQGRETMAMLIMAGHDWDYSTANYTSPRQFCFCGGPTPPDYSKILTGDIKENYEQRCEFVRIYGDVKPLKHSCRLKIRKLIGADIIEKVKLLNLPQSLKNYILLSELPVVMETFSG